MVSQAPSVTVASTASTGASLFIVVIVSLLDIECVLTKLGIPVCWRRDLARASALLADRGSGRSAASLNVTETRQCMEHRRSDQRGLYAGPLTIRADARRWKISMCTHAL